MPKNNNDKYSENEQKVLRRLGNRVCQLRKEAKLSQERLAELAEVHRTYISSIERGQQNISLTILIRLATTFDVSLEKLFTGI